MRKTIAKTALWALVCAALAAGALPPAAHAADGAAIERVARVASRLEGALSFRPRILVEPGAPGAFVLPDGTIVVSAGLAESAESDDEVAFVLAHEASHILAMDQRPGASPALARAGYASEALAREERADAMAVRFMADAGYSPEASIELLKRLANGSGAGLRHRILALSALLGLN